MTRAGCHHRDVDPRDQEHQGDVLVEHSVEELSSDQPVGEDETGDAERTEEQTELTELDHLQAPDSSRLEDFSLT